MSLRDLKEPLLPITPSKSPRTRKNLGNALISRSPGLWFSYRLGNETSSDPLGGSSSMPYMKAMEEKAEIGLTVELLSSLSDPQSPQGWDNFTGSALHRQTLDDTKYNAESTRRW